MPVRVGEGAGGESSLDESCAVCVDSSEKDALEEEARAKYGRCCGGPCA